VKHHLGKIKSSASGPMKILRENGLLYAAGLLTALAVKYHYSRANADDLEWILAPIARLVELMGGIHFEPESGAGFVSLSKGVVIAPACAGVNFLIICFSTLFFTFVSRLQGAGAKWCWFGVCIAASYLVTLWTNAVRIVISIYLYAAPIYGDWITPERVHRLAGTLIYVSVLVATYLAVARIVAHSRCSRPPASTAGLGDARSVATRLRTPLAWYMAITVGVPLLNRSGCHSGLRLAEHAVHVVAATLCILLVWCSAAALLQKKIDIRAETKEKRREG
jgi:exosortase K